jgi:hypothetical protein
MTEAPMRVLVACPQTGAVAPTMLRLKPSAFATLAGSYSFRCVHCGEVHAWRRDEAWLEAPRAR